MSRPLRLEWEGALYHVTARGDRREPIVEDDVDRAAWVEVLAATCERFHWRLHVWCLMGNHYHLLLETPQANLSLGMRQLNGVWSQQFNRRHGRVGHVFQGRFKAIMVQRESYLLELARYVVLNPVRARMVNEVQAYAWSSYRATAGLAPGPGMAHLQAALEPSFEAAALLAMFSPLHHEAQAKYVDFVRAGIGLPPVWQALEGQLFLGSREFLLEMQAKLGSAQRLRDVPQLQQRMARVPLEQWAQRYPRDAAIRQAFASGHYRQRELADFFGLSGATVSRVVRTPNPPVNINQAT